MRNRLVLSALLITLLSVVAGLGAGAASGASGATAVPLKACGTVQYEGTGAPSALIVSDLPLDGDSRERSMQMNTAIELVLKGAGWAAGSTTVGFQACDDSSPKTGLWTRAICQANAKAYAADPSVLAVIGTYNSGCAEIEIPILGKAPGGGVAMVSPDFSSQTPTQQATLVSQLAQKYKANPRDKTTLVYYSAALRSAGQANQAASVLEDGIALYPDDVDIKVAYAKALAASGRFEQALNVVEDAIDPARVATNIRTFTPNTQLARVFRYHQEIENARGIVHAIPSY